MTPKGCDGCHGIANPTFKQLSKPGVSPVVCSMAERRGARRWQARLPIGAGSPAPGETFHVAVSVFDGAHFTYREVEGRYLGA